MPPALTVCLTMPPAAAAQAKRARRCPAARALRSVRNRVQERVAGLDRRRADEFGCASRSCPDRRCRGWVRGAGCIALTVVEVGPGLRIGLVPYVELTGLIRYQHIAHPFAVAVEHGEEPVVHVADGVKDLAASWVASTKQHAGTDKYFGAITALAATRSLKLLVFLSRSPCTKCRKTSPAAPRGGTPPVSASRSVFGRSRLGHARRAIRIFRRASVASMREMRCRFLTCPHSSFVFAAQHESGRASSIARKPVRLCDDAPDGPAWSCT